MTHLGLGRRGPAVRRHRATSYALIALALVLSLVAIGAWKVGFRLNLKTAPVPVPPPDASPVQVVRAYLDAYDHRDFRTMSALYPADLHSSWLERHREMGSIHVWSAGNAARDAGSGE